MRDVPPRARRPARDDRAARLRQRRFPIEPPARLRAAILDAVAAAACRLRDDRPGSLPARSARGHAGGSRRRPGDRAGAARPAEHGPRLARRQAALVSNLVRPGSQVQPLSRHLQGAVVRKGDSGKLVLVDLPKPASGPHLRGVADRANKKPLRAGTFGGGKAVVVGSTATPRAARRGDHRRARRCGSHAPTTKPVASAQLA